MKIDIKALRTLIREELIKEQLGLINEEKMSNSEMTKKLKQHASELADTVKDAHGGNFMELMSSLAKASSDDPGKYKMVQKKLAVLLGVDLKDEPDEDGDLGGGSDEDEKADNLAKLGL